MKDGINLESGFRERQITILDENLPDESPSPTDTEKSFISLPPGVTEPIAIHSDFNIQPLFPVLKATDFDSLKSVTKEYVLLSHCLWFTYGGFQTDPLLEFYLRDGASKKSVFVLPLEKPCLFNISTFASHSYMGRMLFAIPKDRAADVFRWLDGVVLAQDKVFTWVSRRQCLPLTFNERRDVYVASGVHISLYGFQTRTDQVGYLHHSTGHYIAASRPTAKDGIYGVEAKYKAAQEHLAR